MQRPLEVIPCPSDQLQPQGVCHFVVCIVALWWFVVCFVALWWFVVCVLALWWFVVIVLPAFGIS